MYLGLHCASLTKVGTGFLPGLRFALNKGEHIILKHFGKADDHEYS